MSDYRVRLKPIEVEIHAAQGTPLRDLLFDQGVEFPCGGQERCRGCKVRVLEGRAEAGEEQKERLSPAEIAEGWRLACGLRVESDMTIELRQWDAAILANDAAFAFTPREGYGVAVDVGTTTLVAQLLDLRTGHVLAVKTALNPQARHGGDVMSRVEFAMTEGGADTLKTTIREEVDRLIHFLLAANPVEIGQLRHVVLVGNTVMHHLFCGIDIEPLSHVPFEPVNDGLQTFAVEELGWKYAGNATVEFLPCLGGFVGSDILAGLLATGIHEGDDLCALIDLGTNGEIVLGNKNGMLCASTAAGPAFEGARIAMGMRASTGAIYKVSAVDGAFACETLGAASPRGICGSGLVDAAAAALELGLIKPTGRITTGKSFMLADPVELTQTDIRQLQLAKGAIASGVQLLLQRLNAKPEDVRAVYLAGAFGNYVRLSSARRIGLIQFAEEQVNPVGNTALLGAKIALFAGDGDSHGYAALRKLVTHVSLHEDPAFQDTYVAEMGFPSSVE